MFIHFSSLNMEILGDISDYSSWSLESEYSTGGEVYKTWSKNCRINVQAGDIIGQAGGNPGQWALDLGVYDLKSVPEQVANIERWRSCRYLHSVCPLDYYEEGVVRDSLFGLVTGDWIDHKQNLILQDVIGTAQGCWFLEGIKETYPEDLHLALVNSNLDIELQVLSVGQSIDGLVSGRYGFTPNENGLINRDFKDVTPDGNIYGYIVEGYEGIILLIILLAFFDQLLKTMILNLGRLQEKKETPIYGLSLGLGFGSAFTPMLIIAVSSLITNDIYVLSAITVGSFGIILFHGSTGAFIGYGIYRGRLTKYLLTAVIIQLPLNFILAITILYSQPTSLNLILILVSGLILYGGIIFWYVTQRIIPQILVQSKTRKRTNIQKNAK